MKNYTFLIEVNLIFKYFSSIAYHFLYSQLQYAILGNGKIIHDDENEK